MPPFCYATAERPHCLLIYIMRPINPQAFRPENTHENTSLSALVAALALPSLSAAQAPPTAAEAVAGTAVIPRSALFGNPEKTQARVSPDGKYVSFIAPKDGVLNVWVGPRSDPSAAKPVTNDHQARHPPALLGVRQQACAVHPGRRRRRELAPVRHRRGRRHHQGPHSLQGHRRRKSRASRGRSPASSPSASTIACPSGTTCGK